MIFNSKSEETKLVKIGDEYIDRVWSKGKEQSFKLVGIQVDEKLKWDKHYIARKMDWAHLQWFDPLSSGVRITYMGVF